MNKIKALILLLGLTVGFANSSAQQSIFDNPDNRAYIGIRAAFDLVCPTQADATRKHLDKYDKGPGIALGAACYVPLWKNLYFEPSPQFYYNHMKYTVTKSDPDTGTNSLECPISRFGIRFPFALGYRFDFAPCSVSIFTGPIIDFCFSGHYTARTVINSGAQTGKEMKGNFTRTSFAWKFGAGMIVKRYVVELSGTIGTTNSFKSSTNTFRNNVLALTIGYNFSI